MSAEAHLPSTSSRLRLRLLREEDLSDFLAYRTDPEVARFQGWDLISREEALAFLTQMHNQNHFVEGTWFQLGVALEDGDTLIGDVGICVHEPGDVAKIGYSIHRAHQGKGLGTEAVELALAYIFAASDVTRVLAYADVQNVPSWSSRARRHDTTGHEEQRVQG